MKHFQDMGHTVVFLIGDFTGLIGNPTGRSKTRPALTPEEVQANADTYRQQVFRILDPEKTVVDFNSRWLGALRSVEWVKLAAQYNLAQMLERREFRQRYEAGQSIALHEFLYPLSQGYDSVFLRADVELGGTDQLFNLNVGRDIMPAYGLPAQIILTTPLLVGLDGIEKMSKSLGNYVGIDEAPEEMLRKIVEDFRGSDEVLWTYFTLLTDVPPSWIAERQATVRRGRGDGVGIAIRTGAAHRGRLPRRRRGRGGGAGGARAARGATGPGSRAGGAGDPGGAVAPQGPCRHWTCGVGQRGDAEDHAGWRAPRRRGDFRHRRGDCGGHVDDPGRQEADCARARDLTPLYPTPDPSPLTPDPRPPTADSRLPNFSC